MPDPSLRAQLCDLLGEDLESAPARRRLPLAQALRRCPPGQVVAARRGREEVAVVRLDDGRSYVIPDRCPHDGGLLSDGFVEEGHLVCARHGWEFDPASGRCVGRPRVAIDSRPADPGSRPAPRESAGS